MRLRVFGAEDIYVRKRLMPKETFYALNVTKNMSSPFSCFSSPNGLPYLVFFWELISVLLFILFYPFDLNKAIVCYEVFLMLVCVYKGVAPWSSAPLTKTKTTLCFVFYS